MTNNGRITRRDCLKALAAGTVGGSLSCGAVSVSSAEPIPPKSVVAVLTAYSKGLHADVLIGKILEGWKQDGGPGPALKLAGMYVDQFSAGDLARPMAEKYNIPIYDTIEQAVTTGGDTITVDGVISIGEHGDYPWNDKGQHLYPRRRFFKEISDTFEKQDRVVPVFNDKHLGPQWDDAKWMYDRARQMKIPFMAGSSLPVSYRRPEISIPMDCEIEAAVAVGYSGNDIYGSHTLDCLQSLVERRRGGGVGVEWVQCLQGPAMWQAVDDGTVSKEVLEAAMQVTPKQASPKLRDSERAALFLFQYTDGLLGAVFMLPDYLGGISAAVKLKGHAKPQATNFEERLEPRHPHFAYLLKGIERMMHTGRPSYPVERTLLASGILDRALTSMAQDYQRLQTPELAISYQPVDYPHAPHPDLHSHPTARLGT